MRCAIILSSVTCTSRKRGYVTLTTVFMPSLQNFRKVSFNEFSNGVEFPWRKAAIFCQVHRFKPELAKHLLPLHMDMLRLATIEAVEEKSIGTRNAFDGWHVYITRKLSSIKPRFTLTPERKASRVRTVRVTPRRLIRHGLT